MLILMISKCTFLNGVALFCLCHVLGCDGWTSSSCHFVVVSPTCKNMSSSSVHFCKAECQCVFDLNEFPFLNNYCFTLPLNLLTHLPPPPPPVHLVSECTFWKKSTLTHLHAECLGSSCERRIEMEIGRKERADYTLQMHALPPGWPTS